MPAAPHLTDAQRELLTDKYVLWDRAAREGSPDMRDYNRRTADALKAVMALACDPLDAAREAFLNLIAEAKRWDEDVDGEYHTDSPTPTITVRYFGEFRESEVRDLTEALGITVHYDELAGAAIDRRLKADEAALARVEA